MIEQASLDLSGYWFALISAAPVPERPERASVAVLFGNGRPFRLSFLHGLPRLASLAPVDQSAAFEAVLASVQESIAMGRLSLIELRSALGPQLRVETLRPLTAELSDDLVARLGSHYLAAVRQPEREGSTHAVVRSSRALLDALLGRTVPDDLRTTRNVTASKLLPNFRGRSFDSIPAIARSLSGAHRDVLLDSISIEARFRIASMRAAESKIAEAFYGFGRHVAPIAQNRYGRAVRVVGVVHRLADSATDELRMFREYVLKSWSDEAEVVDGEKVEVGPEIHRLAAWARESDPSRN